MTVRILELRREERAELSEEWKRRKEISQQLLCAKIKGVASKMRRQQVRKGEF